MGADEDGISFWHDETVPQLNCGGYTTLPEHIENAGKGLNLWYVHYIIKKWLLAIPLG